MEENKVPTSTSKTAEAIPVKKRKTLLRRLLEILCAVSLGGIVVLLSAQVAMRHVAGGSLPWSGEMATWLFSWSTFIGAVLVYMEKKHIVIDFLIAFLSPNYIKIIDFFQNVLILAVLIVLLVTGVQITLLYANQTATSIEISKAFLFMSLPISSALMIGWSLYNWIRGRFRSC